MKLIEMSLMNFANEVDSLSPAPGGGSCSAYSSAVGVSLSRMMAKLSFGKKKFEIHDESVKKDFEIAYEELNVIKEELFNLVDKDTESFNEVMKAIKMPKDTEEEKLLRKDALEFATWGSIEVPYQIAKLSQEAMEKMEIILNYGNENALTDIGVAYLMCASGAEGAILNVKINLGSVADIERGKNLESQCNKILEHVRAKRDTVLDRIHDNLKM